MNWISKENMSVTHYYDANMIHLSVTMESDHGTQKAVHKTGTDLGVDFGNIARDMERYCGLGAVKK